ncbi:MAG: dephospho-CoA kinase [Deltaproteobacteria bacterium CG11_big_fil_rev_8_21_14_0_20_49_13]|nr:MAG: dephospho-CoA kinase [Deltaproteobacteria bacterium CG11_big_fil_rev_8_21_14_0_20_49_13]
MRQNPKRIKLIGLTGGIATGKSLTAKAFHRLGVPTVDTDTIAHELLKKGRLEYYRTVALFGRRILGDKGEIDRNKLARIVFAKGAAAAYLRKRLESILHPAIWKAVLSFEQAHRRRPSGEVIRHKCKFMVVEVPLLFETGWDKKVDVKIVVACSKKAMYDRCKKRFRNRICTQWPLAKKIPLADYIIDSSGPKHLTFPQVKRLFDLLSNQS